MHEAAIGGWGGQFVVSVGGPCAAGLPAQKPAGAQKSGTRRRGSGDKMIIVIVMATTIIMAIVIIVIVGPAPPLGFEYC